MLSPNSHRKHKKNTDMIKLFNYIREYFSYEILPCKNELNPRPLKNKNTTLIFK